MTGTTTPSRASPTGSRIARRRGSRTGEWESFSETTYPLFMLGRWDEAREAFSEVPEDRYLDALTVSFLSGVLELHVHRGQVAEAARLLSLYEPLRDSADLQNRTCFLAAEASVARADGRLEEALASGLRPPISRAARVQTPLSRSSRGWWSRSRPPSHWVSVRRPKSSS